MTPTARLTGIAVFAALAIALLAYTGWRARAEIVGLREEVGFLQDQIAQQPSLSAYWAWLGSAEFDATLAEAVAENDPEERAQAVDRLFSGFDGLYLPAEDGFRIDDLLTGVIEGETEADRAVSAGFLREEFSVGVDLQPVVNAPPGGDFLIAAVPVLVTALGALGSGMMSGILYLQGGPRRRLEDEMLGLDVEKKRLEVARLRQAMAEGTA